MLRRTAAALAALSLACATLTPQGERVAVFQAPLPASGAPADMPAGCRIASMYPPVDMNERDMTTDKDPYLLQRNRAGAAGANALLVRSRMIAPRQDFNCPAASPITDCPRSVGAWFLVVFEDYSCSTEALATLAKATPPPAR